MCLASKFLKEVKTLKRRIDDERENLTNLLSDLDKEMSRLYHNVEATNFNAAEGYCYAKKMQDTLRKRRVVKQELQKLHSLSTNMNFEVVNELLGTTEKNLSRTISRIHKEEMQFSQNWKENYRVEDLLQVH